MQTIRALPPLLRIPASTENESAGAGMRVRADQRRTLVGQARAQVEANPNDYVALAKWGEVRSTPLSALSVLLCCDDGLRGSSRMKIDGVHPVSAKRLACPAPWHWVFANTTRRLS